LKVLFLGFGDLARRTAEILTAQDWQITGLRRTPVTQQTIAMVAGDCRDPALLTQILPGQDIVVASFTPDDYTENGYRSAYVEPAMAMVAAMSDPDCRPGHVIWVSSTSVYGDGDGGWVDEMSPARPASHSGRLLLEAEQCIAEGPVRSTIIRFSGIYGRGRPRMIEQVARGECAPEHPVKWTNRIHCDDCAGVLSHFCQRIANNATVEPLYIATDCEPSPLHQVHKWLADRLGVECRDVGSAGALRGNRRCSNARLLASGYRFRYPGFREGYDSCLPITPKREPR
jgi:nucleoside-diphosphate-sugar epimerase